MPILRLTIFLYGMSTSEVQHSVLASYFSDTSYEPLLGFYSDLINLGERKDVHYTGDISRSKGDTILV